MLKKYLFILLCLGIALPVMAAGTKINYGKIDFVIGKVIVEQTFGKKVDAKLNMKVFEGDKVRTSKGATVQIVLGKDTKIRIAANSEFQLKKNQVNQANEKETVLGLNFGKLWANVAKLKKDQKFSIETPTAVAGVRGTIFVVKQNDEGTTLYVGKGAMSFLSKMLNEEVNVGDSFMITLGKDGKLSGTRKMTDQDMKDMMSGIPVFFKEGDKGLKDELKSEIDSEKGNLEQQQNMTGQLKSDDLTAGRTLRDINGNIVRVEQIFRKKDKVSFQILNITKRDNGIAYFDFTAIFNKELPDDFKKWSDFFQNNDVNMDKRDVTFGSKTAAGVDSMRWFGDYNNTTGKFEDKYYVNGVEMKGDKGDFEDDVIFDESSKSEIYSTGNLKLTETGGTHAVHNIKISIYVIDNNGNKLSEKYFTSSDNILNIFNSVAGEIVISSADFISGEIDVVTIPDIAFVIIQEIM